MTAEVKDSEQGKENEIRVSSKGRMAMYISYASTLMTEKGYDTFTIRATGAALTSAITVAEVVKRRFVGLHQVTALSTIDVDKRSMSFIEITLSKNKLDEKSVGYQPPLPASEVVEMDANEILERGRRGRGKKDSETKDGDDSEKKPKGKGKKGKGKGKGRGRKGKGKGKKQQKDESDDE